MLVSRLTYAVVKVPLVFSAPWFITSGAVNPAFNISGPAALILKAGIVPVPSSPSVSPHCPGPSPRSSPADPPTAALVPHWRFRGCGSVVAAGGLILGSRAARGTQLTKLARPFLGIQPCEPSCLGQRSPANDLRLTISGHRVGPTHPEPWRLADSNR